MGGCLELTQVEEEIQCEHCDAEFTIQYDEDKNKLILCPFCGASLEDAYIQEDADLEEE